MLTENDVKHNSAEYVLYLWQMEDLFRAVEFDINRLLPLLEQNKSLGEVEIRREMNRFQLLVSEMRAEGIMETGHLSRSLKLVAELFVLHRSLLTVNKDKEYQVIYHEALPNLNEFISRTPQKKMNEIEACFNALYGLFVLRLKKEPVSAATEQAMASFSRMLAYLAEKHRGFKIHLN